MDIDVKKKFENKLFNRIEVEFLVTYESSTPTRQKVIDKLAGLLNVKKNLIILESLKGEFGSKSAKGKADIYSDEETMKDIAKKHLIKRSQKEEPKKEEKPVKKK